MGSSRTVVGKEVDEKTPLYRPSLPPQEKGEEKIRGFYFPRRVNVVVLSFFCTTIAYMMRANLSIAIVDMSVKFGWPSSEKGLYLSAFFWGYITTQIIGGIAARRVGPKWVMAFVIAVPSVCTLLIPVVAHRSAVLMVACRVLTGVASGPTFPSLYLMLSQWTPFSERALALSLALSGSAIGTIIIDTVGPVIINHLGWEYVFYISGSIGFVWLTIWILTVTSSPEEMASIHPLEKQWILGIKTEKSPLVDEKSYRMINAEDPIAIPTVGLSNWDALKTLAKHSSFWVIVFNGLCINWGYYIFLTWLPTYAHSGLGFNLQWSGIIAITPQIASSIVGYLAGGLCDRILKTGVRVLVVRKVFFFIGTSMYVIALVLIAYMKDLGFSSIIAVVILAGGTSGGGLQVPGYSANVYDIAPDHSSLVVGVSNTAATIPGIIGVYSTGLILQSGAGWGLIWLITAGFYFTALVAHAIFTDVKRIV